MSRDTRTIWRQELDERCARAAAEQERLDDTLTRREVIEALDESAQAYSDSGMPQSDMIADAFRMLAKALA